MDWPSAIGKFRRRAGLKQKALAELLDCDQTAISHWERGVDKPSLAFQGRLAALIARDRAHSGTSTFTSTGAAFPRQGVQCASGSRRSYHRKMV